VPTPFASKLLGSHPVAVSSCPLDAPQWNYLDEFIVVGVDLKVILVFERVIMLQKRFKSSLLRQPIVRTSQIMKIAY
jgi:hypothetical protein